MEKACHSISRLLNPIPTACSKPKTHSLSLGTYSCPCSNVRASKKDEVSQSIKKNSRKRSRTPRRLITISTTDGRWQGQWTNDYIFSLRELQLEDLAEEGQKDTQVSIHLDIQKHTGFGFSVDGRIITSFTRKCSNCFSPYCREIKTTFNVWVLPFSRDKHALQLPEMGGDDPSVIYAKPGSEVDLDSLIQETLRLTTSVKDTCSESCEKLPPSWHYIGGKEPYVDKRWSGLLEMRNRI
eukprot:TRINITY_DN9246_c0_g1_i1.p1 TRINITY_DN9246_c0_g1~~TRINITY_DN9246_c0_g1_i1.p1  ORF type:complete len:239 (-),score=34.65 TRINITY_DN9246_c0_g1_i1:358-1074(-)